MIKLFSHLNKKNPATGFRVAVMDLFSDMMSVKSVTDTQKGQLARLRARIEIELKNFN